MTQIERNKRTEHQFNAFIDYYLSFPNYLGSYKRSFDILIKDVLVTDFHVDYIAYPILFLARHCMELGLKTNIRYFAKYSEKDDYVKAGTHDLENLFRAFKMHVDKTFETLKTKYGIEVERDDKKSFKELCEEVEKLNNTFHLLDKNSDAFRYPIDKKQNPSFKKGERINVIDIAELLEKSMTLFVHTADVFAKYTDYADEIENYYEGLMREQYEQNIPY
ncbi:hypothetical protein [Tenacibaculum sp. SDUM215027]|uniref:hypothetical protein n=1 Tax=Tenacibaculum sp. SDUM215027 TaxID=3422596 RepID=UPI003D310DBC